LPAPVIRSRAGNLSDDLPDQGAGNLRHDPPRVDLIREYVGLKGFDDEAMLGDATMRTPYRYAMMRKADPTVLVRPLNSGTVIFLDYLQRVGTATRAEVAAETILTPGAAAGASRIAEQLGLVVVEWDGPGTPKLYTIRDDWRDRLHKLIPEMTTFGALSRLVDRNLAEQVAHYERQIDAIRRKAERRKQDLSSEQEAEIGELEGRRRKIEGHRNRLRLAAIRAGRIGRPAREQWERMQWAA